MKKQLFIAAIAASISTMAMADISLTGSASHEYKNTVQGKKKDNTSSTEASMEIKGSKGDTKVVVGLSFHKAAINIEKNDDGTDKVADVEDSKGNKSLNADGIERNNVVGVDDLYLTTKLGPVSAKFGNWKGGSDSLLGEIKQRNRSTNQMDLSYTTNGVKFYIGSGASHKKVNSNSYVGVVATISDWKLKAEKSNKEVNAFGVSGKSGPVGMRFEMLNSNKKDANAMFLNFNTELEGISFALDMLKSDKDGAITEDDASFKSYQKNANDDISQNNTQVSASIKADGTTYGAAFGQNSFSTKGVKSRNYYKISAGRDLAAGTNLDVSYKNAATGDENNEKSFAVKVSVDF